MKKLIALIVVVLLLWPSVAFAETSMLDAIKDLEASGKQSNACINHSIIDLVYLPSQGSVTAYTYMGANEYLTINNFSVSPQTILEAHDKLTRFIFELTNRYRPDTDLALSGLGALPSVHAWTYGAMKDEAMWAIVYGLEDCLNNPPYDWRNKYDYDSSNDASYIDKYSPENITTTLEAIFKIGAATYSIGEETKTMDVVPEIKDNRTFVPIRYLAYALEVDEDGIKWDGTTQSVTITKGTTTLGLKIGSDILTVNGVEQQMDVAPYIKNGRTMLPARWIAEPLGAEVHWDEKTGEITIKQGL